MQLSSGPRHLVKEDFSVHSYSGRASIKHALKVDFHCRVIFSVPTHINFTRVHKIEAMYGMSRLKVKVEPS